MLRKARVSWSLLVPGTDWTGGWCGVGPGGARETKNTMKH